MAGLLSRVRIVAGPGFNRWLVPPPRWPSISRIGQAYALQRLQAAAQPRLIGITDSAPDATGSRAAGLDVHALPSSSSGFRRRCSGGGSSTPGPGRRCRGGRLLGRRVPHLGRWACMLHQIWLLYLGYGVLGGCGLGLGYISPVSTLIKWFPDRRGMATGMAIMGFGGGAMIGAPAGGSA